MKIFNSNTKKLNRVVPKTNINKIEGATFVDKLVNDFKNQLLTSGSMDGRDKNGNELPFAEKMVEFSASLNYDYETSFDSRIRKTFNSKNRTNPNTNTIKRNEKDLVLGFRDSIMDITANWIFRQPDLIEILDDARIKLIFNNVYLQGATNISTSDFHVYVNGVKAPTYLSLEQTSTGTNLIINEFIGIDSTNKDKTNIYVKGKFEQ
jgi:hypothetical protein